MPAVLVVLTLAAAFIPNVSFTLEQELKQSRSLVLLMTDAWKQCREYINNEQAVMAVPAIQSFSLWTMIGIIVSAVIAAVSAVLSVWSSVTAVLIIRAPETVESEERRRMLCRVMPGIWWMMAANWLAVIPMLFPYYLSAMYTHVLHLNTDVSSGLTVIAVALAAVSGIVAAVSRGFERELGMSPFELQ